MFLGLTCFVSVGALRGHVVSFNNDHVRPERRSTRSTRASVDVAGGLRRAEAVLAAANLMTLAMVCNNAIRNILWKIR